MRQDSMYNISNDVTMLQLNLGIWAKEQYSNRLIKSAMLPRMMWVRKDIDMKQLHMSVFTHLRQVFSEWADWTHPETTRTPKGNVNLRNLIEFPFRVNEDE